MGNNGLINKAEVAKRYYANDTAYTEGAIVNVESYINDILIGSGNATQGPEMPSEPEPITVAEVEAGKKIYYDTGDVTIGNNGIIECVVLYDKAYNELNNTNYGIQIIPLNTVGEQVFIGVDNNYTTTKTEYNNGISILNSRAEEYRNKNDGIAISSRCVGSVPDNPSYDLENYVTGGFENLASYDGEVKNTDSNYVTDLEQMEKLGIVESDNEYWLASRYVEYFYGEGGLWAYDAHFRSIYNNSLDDNGILIFTYDGWGTVTIDSYGQENYLRPVFTLNPEAKIVSGDGENTPYTLEI